MRFDDSSLPKYTIVIINSHAAYSSLQYKELLSNFINTILLLASTPSYQACLSTSSTLFLRSPLCDNANYIRIYKAVLNQTPMQKLYKAPSPAFQMQSERKFKLR